MVRGRKPGAQPGNKNAHKHGFYSKALSAAGRRVLRRASEIDAAELEHEIALLRARIFELVRVEPKNVQVLSMALRTLVRLVAVNHGLSAEQEEDIHSSLRDLLRDLMPLAGGL